LGSFVAILTLPEFGIIRVVNPANDAMKAIDLQIPRHAATLRTLVEAKVRSAILSGQFKPGQRLVERELCELIGVGRTSIREALRQLEAEGLVSNIPHRGPSVSRISYEEAEQLYAFRGLLEGYAGEQFALHGSASDVARLTEAVGKFKLAAETQNGTAILQAKTDFYDVLMDGSGNAFLKQALKLLHNRINLLRATSMMQSGRLKHSAAEICEIHDAIKARDSKRAASACQHHISMAARAALKFLREHPAS
jgi:DNA-binding GntR family transcriptional regulator